MLEVVYAHCRGSIHLGREGTKPNLQLFKEDFLHGPGQPIAVLKKLIHVIQTSDWLVDDALGIDLFVLAQLVSVDYGLLAVYHGTPALFLINQVLRRQRKLGSRDCDSWVWTNAARNVECVRLH